MSDFAKVFHSKQYGQMVVIMQGADETGQPELRVFMQPEGYGVCSLAIQFNDTESGLDECEAKFEELDLALAEAVAKALFDHIS